MAASGAAVLHLLALKPSCIVKCCLGRRCEESPSGVEKLSKAIVKTKGSERLERREWSGVE